jgi:hypothetical protein
MYGFLLATLNSICTNRRLIGLISAARNQVVPRYIFSYLSKLSDTLWLFQLLNQEVDRIRWPAYADALHELLEELINLLGL